MLLFTCRAMHPQVLLLVVGPGISLSSSAAGQKVSAKLQSSLARQGHQLW